MAQHVEINPDNESLPFSLGLKAVRLASTQKTHKTGTVRIPTSTGKDFIAGKGAEDGANWIDSEGVQTPLVDTAAIDKAVDEIGRKADAAAASADKAYEEAKRTGQLAVTASRTEYATSTDATATPSDGWSETPPTYMDGQYTWLRVTVTYGDGHTELSNPVLMTGPKGGKGETGETGTTGVSVTSLTTFWRLAADTPDTPSGADDPSGWSRTEPSIPDGYEGRLYRTIRTIMSDGTATWTSPDVDSMFEYMARTYRTASGAVTVSSEAKRTAEGNAETIKQVGTTANDALNKATTVEANLNSYKTTVSETYATNSKVDDLATGGSNLLEHVNPTDLKVSYWVNEGMSTFDVQKLTTYTGVEKVTYGWRFKCGNTTSPLTNRVYYDVNKFTHIKDQAYTFSAWVKVGSGTATIKAQIAGGVDIASIKATTTWTRITGTYVASAAGSLTLRCSGTTEWYMCAPYVASCPEWITNRSYVNQTAQSVALGVVKDYKGADGSGLATKSDISVSKTEITSEVSSKYATKDGVTKEISSKITQNNSSWELKFETKQDSDNKITEVKASSMTGIRVEYALGTSSTSAPTSGWSTTAPAWVDGKYMWQRTVTQLGNGTSSTSDATCISGAQGPKGTTGQTGKGASGITPEYYLSTSNSTQSGGSWSATQSWSTGKYLWTRSKCTWTDGSVTYTTPVLADALNKANTAAADAQSRVGNLEPCIRMTSDGVRVGKQANGAYQGTSALVGTDGTFDVLDSSSKRLLEVGSSGVKFPKSSDGHQLALGYVTDSTTKTDTLYIGDVVSGQQEGGPKNRLGFTGSQVSLEGGDISINANDNQLSLYGHKGANLLVPSGGNVQVGGQAGSTSTTLTLRGSTVNLSGGLVNVNGRTLNAPVDAKQSQRWDNIQLDVKCVNRVVTVNVLHPLGTNAIIGDQSDQCEIGYIKEGYRPSRMIGCHLASYNTTNLFLEINPATGKVACFRLWGNQNTWAYFSASLSYVI